MKAVIKGNQAVAHGARLSRVEVISAYPITPQTTIVEELASMVGEGKLKAEFIKVESEHSALAGCYGAQAAGARSFTATSSQGLALMHEIIHWMAGARLPMVMANVNRAMAPGWNIWTDQTDSLAQRDTGWMQVYCESSQEVVDTVIQAYKISEKVSLPTMVILDAFVLSHTSEPVDIPEQPDVDRFLPPYKPLWKLDLDDPGAFGNIVAPNLYMEFRRHMRDAHQRARSVIGEVGKEFGEIFGREYHQVEPFHVEDADVVLVTSGAMSSTVRHVIRQRREKGEKIGQLKMRYFRPFPTVEVQRLLAGVPKVAVIDRNFSFGHHGIWAEELKSALYPLNGSRPGVWGYVAGLGGRDVTTDTINEIIDRTIQSDKPDSEVWIGLKPEGEQGGVQ